jgi:glucosamine kinase
MKIIAESGSTKTDWVFIHPDKETVTFTKEGFNPNYFPPIVLDNMIEGLISAIKPGEVTHIFFYGAGCASVRSKAVVNEVLRKYFRMAVVEIHHDLFGAARALFGQGTGIAAVLGTGSSSCLIHNNQIRYVVPSLGYLLADEGSGAHLGNLILNAYFKKDLSAELEMLFESEFGIDKNTFVRKLYAREKPNSYIASFTPFVIEHQDKEEIGKLIMKAFRVFFEENILKYPDYENYELGFTGSVAALLREQLICVAGEYNLNVAKVIRNPINDLVDYHLKNN